MLTLLNTITNIIPIYRKWTMLTLPDPITNNIYGREFHSITNYPICNFNIVIYGLSMQSKSNYENNNIMNGNLRINKFSFAISLFILSENFPFLRQIAQNSPTNQELSHVHPVKFF